MLAGQPVLAAFTIVALAFGTGFTVTMFGVVDTVLLQGLPFPDSDRIMAVGLSGAASESPVRDVALRDYLDWRNRLGSFEELAAYSEGSVNLSAPGGPVRYSGAWITANVFATLRVEPAAGRPFREGRRRAGCAAGRDPVPQPRGVELFAGSPGTTGDTVTVNGEAAEVVGIMPEGFHFPRRQDIWMPLRAGAPGESRGAATPLSVFGRAGPGVSAGDATAEFDRILEGSSAARSRVGASAEVVPFTRAAVLDGVVPVLWATLGVAALVFMTACANAANLLLLRAAARVARDRDSDGHGRPPRHGRVQGGPGECGPGACSARCSAPGSPGSASACSTAPPP